MPLHFSSMNNFVMLAFAQIMKHVSFFHVAIPARVACPQMAWFPTPFPTIVSALLQSRLLSALLTLSLFCFFPFSANDHRPGEGEEGEVENCRRRRHLRILQIASESTEAKYEFHSGSISIPLTFAYNVTCRLVHMTVSIRSSEQSNHLRLFYS